MATAEYCMVLDKIKQQYLHYMLFFWDRLLLTETKEGGN